MRNRDVAKSFVTGTNPTAHTANLSIHRDGRELKSYWTVIAERTGTDRVFINPRKYSMTTSHHQSALRGELASAGYTCTGKDDHGWERWERQPAAPNHDPLSFEGFVDAVKDAGGRAG